MGEFPKTETVHFPKSCQHCEEPPCVPVCPTSASYKRPEYSIVLVDYDKCIGCKCCSWACPYGARELHERQKVMKTCTLCVGRIYEEPLPGPGRRPACVLACPTNARLFGDIHDPDSKVSVAIRENSGYQLMPEWGTQLANHYLPRRTTRITAHPDELVRADNPLAKGRREGAAAQGPPDPGRYHELVASFWGETDNTEGPPTMHPAFSVIFLTTLLGVRQGPFLALYTGQLYDLINLLPPQNNQTFYGLGSALSVGFLMAGLIASFFPWDTPNGPGGPQPAGGPPGCGARSSSCRC